LAWDESVALFREEGGDDRYEGGGFSQGASAMNGWIMFLELGGRDTYLYTDQATSNSNDYHGGTSLSFFIDAGGEEDVYHKKKNNNLSHGGQHWLFLDLPGTIAAALKDDAWQKLVPPEGDKTNAKP